MFADLEVIHHAGNMFVADDSVVVVKQAVMRNEIVNEVLAFGKQRASQVAFIQVLHLLCNLNIFACVFASAVDEILKKNEKNMFWLLENKIWKCNKKFLKLKKLHIEDEPLRKFCYFQFSCKSLQSWWC